jgi:hypothetical protein
MANDLRSLQASAARDAEWLQVVMKQHAPAIDAAALESLDTFHIDTEYRETLKRRLEQRGGLTAHIAEAISHLVRDSAIAPRASASPCAVLGALALAAALTLQVETLALILFLMDINGCF